MRDKLFVAVQYLLPHYFLSACIHNLTRLQAPWFKDRLIAGFIKYFKVNMAEAAEPDPRQYATFNDFFTRELNDHARALNKSPSTLLCPVDGCISQSGTIRHSEIFQAKGKSFNLTALLGSESRAERFEDGSFSTIYLSPRDYHRVHFPLDARLTEMVHIPGNLFSVNPVTTENIEGLFAKNERVCAFFETDAGPMAMILVGAIFVSSIETVWHGEVTPPRHNQIRVWHYDTGQSTHHFEQGQELGRFNMGSTIIMLFGKDQIAWAESHVAGQPVQLGQTIGQINHC